MGNIIDVRLKTVVEDKKAVFKFEILQRTRDYIASGQFSHLREGRWNPHDVTDLNGYFVQWKPIRNFKNERFYFVEPYGPQKAKSFKKIDTAKKFYEIIRKFILLND